ncbi:DUF4880 domain-containing protein [Lysobacter pythonis]|uniref:DUF4880 domain-containing protein n=1 Tax=Solilutibacter pythonis TaxID=2483112 RepID=A0A3M2HJW4_9GAMM|nr:FecR domain-containing protein [Lysobacter pythonis]RMH87880.1 DUF4880 domain-containing protein [Lysobacter pythonis]
MSPPHPAFTTNASLAEQARAWIVWLSSGRVDEAGIRVFEQWLARPGHRLAYEHERALWRSLGPRPSAAPVRRMRWAMAAAAALAVLLVWPDAWLRLQADHRSGPMVRAVQLPDGSRAVLDAGSAIAVHFDGQARRVELLRGRVWFEVKPDAGRRFSVAAGNGVVEDVSTAFTVARTDEAVEARVGQGRIRVAYPAGGGWTYLRAGQRAAYGGAAGVTRLGDVAVDSVGAWRQGELLLERASVADALRRLGRYRSGPILVHGDLSRLPTVSAALRIDRPEQALDTLAASAGLQVTRLPLGVAIVRAAPR